MWSHYADNHQGICLEFESEILAESFKLNAYEVSYSESIPSPNSNGLGDYLLNKSKDWSYEKEVRFYEIISPWENGSAVGKRQFDPAALTGVIFGYKINRENYKRYYDFAKSLNPECRIFRSYKIDGKYALYAKELSVDTL